MRGKILAEREEEKGLGYVMCTIHIMAEKTIDNGVAIDGEDSGAENFYDFNDSSNNNAKVTEMTRKIEALSLEKLELVHENGEMKNRITNLSAEIGGLRNESAQLRQRLGRMEGEMAESEESKKTLQSVAGRAQELETEVFRLQHDLKSAMNEVEEANSVIAELKKVLGEKGSKIEGLDVEIESLKKAKAESEKKSRDLERQVGVLEVRETEERSKKLRAAEEMRDKINEKDREISGLKKKVEDLEREVAKNCVVLDEWKMEKKVMEQAVRVAEEREKAVELKVVELQREAEEAGKLINGMKYRAIEAVDEAKILETGDDKEQGYKGLASQWPVVAIGSAGAIAATTAVIYVFYARRR